MSRYLKDWLTEYVDYCCSTSEPPEIFHRWCGLSLIAAALQRKCFLTWGNMKFYPNLYIVIVAPSGRARKGTAISYYLNMAEELQIPLAAEAITREALIQALNATRKSDPDPRTGELDTHSSLTIVSPELTVFLGYQNHQLMSDLTDWYDCRSRWIYRTKTSTSDEIFGVWVNMLGATTPELVRTSLPLDAIGGGLTSRIIFVYAEDKGRLCPAPFITPEHQSQWKKLMHDLEQIHLLKGQFQVSQDFLNRWIDWYQNEAQLYPFDDPRFGGYSERRPNHVMKLSLVYSASRTDSMEVTSEDFENALKTLKETEYEMPKVFAGVGQLEYSNIIWEILQFLSRVKETSKSHIMRKFYRDIDERKMDAVLRSLEISGSITTSWDGKERKVKYVEEENKSV